MATYTAHATLIDKTTRRVEVEAECETEARRLMFASNRAIASITGPRSAATTPPARSEYMRRNGDEGA